MMEHVCDCGWMVYTDRPIACGRCGRIVGGSSAKLRWPLWARCVALARISTDRGVGGTLDRILWYAGGGIYKRLYQAIRGKKCGCQSRREKWNRRFPYDA